MHDGEVRAHRASSDRSEPAVWAQIWNSRSAYGGPATVRFILNTDTAGYPLVNETAYAAAAEHGLARIDLLADGVLVGTTTERPWSITWDAGTLPESPLRLTTRSYDQAGHTFDTVFDSRVDHTAPTLVVRSNGYIRAGGELYVPAVKFAKAPKNKTKVTKTFAVTAKATDRYGITRVPLLVNGKVVATDSEAGYRFTVNPKKCGKKFAVHLRAYDRAGNLKNSSKRTYRR